jgi:hypothetical protein
VVRGAFPTQAEHHTLFEMRWCDGAVVVRRRRRGVGEQRAVRQHVQQQHLRPTPNRFVARLGTFTTGDDARLLPQCSNSNFAAEG